MIGGDALSTTNVIDSLSYRAFGSASQVVYGNDRKLDLSYNAGLNQMNSMILSRWDGTQKIDDRYYWYETNGLISQVYDNLDYYWKSDYQYNYRNQLTSASSGFLGPWDPAIVSTHSFDNFGNKTNGMTFAKIGTSSTPVNNRPTSYTSGAYTTNFTFDNAGNMTAAGATTYQWDGANRLKSVNNGTSGSYGYDGNSKRVKKTEGATTIYYVYSSVIGSAVMEVATTGVQRAYVMNGGSVVAQLNANGNFYWMHPDQLGNGHIMTDSTGALAYRAEIDPYGVIVYEWSAAANMTTKKFTGYERDAGTGLDYAQARMYNQFTQRFMSPDPAGLSSTNPYSPKSLNRYTYVDGDPVNKVDPLGLYGQAPPNPIIITNGTMQVIGTLDKVSPNGYGITGYSAAQEQLRKAVEITRYWIQFVQQAVVPSLPRPKGSPSEIDFSNHATDFFKNNPECAKIINSLAAQNGRDTIDATIKSTTFKDVTADVALGMTPTSKVTGNFGDNSNLLEKLAQEYKGSTTYALTSLSLQGATVYFGFAYLNADANSSYLQSVVPAHEIMHALFRDGSHVSLANMFKIKFIGGEAEASEAINSWLNNKCSG